MSENGLYKHYITIGFVYESIASQNIYIVNGSNRLKLGSVSALKILYK